MKSPLLLSNRYIYALRLLLFQGSQLTEPIYSVLSSPGELWPALNGLPACTCVAFGACARPMMLQNPILTAEERRPWREVTAGEERISFRVSLNSAGWRFSSMVSGWFSAEDSSVYLLIHRVNLRMWLQEKLQFHQNSSCFLKNNILYDQTHMRVLPITKFQVRCVNVPLNLIFIYRK